MTVIQQVFSGQETNYLLGQGKLFFAPINSITKLAEDKAKFVGNVPEEGFSIAPTVQTVQHNESITGKNRRDAVFHPGQSLTVTARLENVDLDNLTQAMFGTSLKLLEATVSNEIHTAYKGYSFSLNRPNVGNLTIVNPSGLVFNQDYRVNLKTGEVFIPENSQIVDGSLVTVYYTAPPVNRITGYTGLNTEVWVRFNGLNMADKLNLIIAEIFKVRFNPASVLDFIKNAFPGTQLELIGEALYEPRLERVADYEGGIFRIFSIGKTIDNFTPEPDPFIPDGSLIYCQLNVNNFRPVDTVDGSLTYCQLSESVVNSFRPADPPPLDPEIILLLSGNGNNNSTNIIDSSPNPKLITVFGSTSINTAESRLGNGCIELDGNGDYLEFNYTPNFVFSEEFRVETWFKAKALTGSQAIISKDTSGVNLDFGIFIINNNNLTVYTNRGFQNLTVSVPSMNTNTWYKIVFERKLISGILTNTIYLNDIAYGSNTMQITNDSQVKLTIGAAGWNNPNSFFNGFIEDFKITL